MIMYMCSEARQILLRIYTRSNVTRRLGSSKIPTLKTARWTSTHPILSLRQVTKQTTLPTTMSTTQLAHKTSALHVCFGNKRTLFNHRVLRDYEELPREYRDQAGVPIGKELSGQQVSTLFGAELSPAAANHLLRILHGRRVAGTLNDPAFLVNTSQFTQVQISTALMYLRKAIPVEEVRNAGLRAEDELDQIEREMQDAAAAKREREKINNGKEHIEEDPEAIDNVSVPDVNPDPIYGRSSFDVMRAKNQAIQKARNKVLEEEKLKRDAEQAEVAPGALSTQRATGREITNPRVLEYYKAAESDLAEPPQMSAWRRILPSVTLVASTLGLLTVASMVYEEPMPKYRLFPDLSTAHATVAAIIAVNSLVYLGWKVPPLWSLFNRYMIFVVATVKPVTMFTAMFSHIKFSHLLVNMIPLWFVGTQIHDEIGRADFLTLYLSCGAGGFLGSLITYTLRGWLTVTSLGASGATLGLCSAYFWEHRTDGFKILGLPQDGVHGIVFLALIIAVQLAGFGKIQKLKVDLASHLTGIAAGILGLELIDRRKKTSQEPGSKQRVIEVLSGNSAAFKESSHPKKS